MALVVVRGSGDVGSAVALCLFRRGHRVALHDEPRPPHARRGMAFTDAYFDGRCELEGILAKRARDLEGLALMLECGRAVPVTDADFPDVVACVRPEVLVDARIHKHRLPEPLRGAATCTIGLGPNFEAGGNADVVVETAWGDDLGRVIRDGRARELEGDPRPIAGHSRDRYVYSTVDGVFETGLAIGAVVDASEPVARIGDVVIRAPLSGILRGLTHHGANVTTGTKVLEVDPRGCRGAAFGIGERPARIAAGVLQAIGQARPDSRYRS